MIDVLSCHLLNLTEGRKQNAAGSELRCGPSAFSSHDARQRGLMQKSPRNCTWYLPPQSWCLVAQVRSTGHRTFTYPLSVPGVGIETEVWSEIEHDVPGRGSRDPELWKCERNVRRRWWRFRAAARRYADTGCSFYAAARLRVRKFFAPCRIDCARGDTP